MVITLALRMAIVPEVATGTVLDVFEIHLREGFLPRAVPQRAIKS
jgi:hypothetical protein